MTDEPKPDVEQFVRGHIRRNAEDRIGDAIVPVDEESDSLLDVVLPREMPTVVVDHACEPSRQARRAAGGHLKAPRSCHDRHHAERYLHAFKKRDAEAAAVFE